MNQFTVLFLVLLALTTVLKLWLAARHGAYVIANRDKVPERFAGKISLESHQKAADYTHAKVQLNLLSIVIDALVLLAFTLGGGINWLDQFWRGSLGEGLASGVAIIASIVLIGGLIDLPMSLYRTFTCYFYARCRRYSWRSGHRSAARCGHLLVKKRRYT